MPKPSDSLELRYVLLDELADQFLEGNPKRHDIGSLSQSIERYGFRDPLTYDGKLNGGSGAIIEGNGRLEALVKMRKSGRPCPRGLKLDTEGRWCVPVLYGVEAENEGEAIAYSFDHNSMVLSGGSFTALDISGLYEPEQYLECLTQLAHLEIMPITVDYDDLELLRNELNKVDDEPIGAEKEKQPRTVVCPHCGEVLDLDAK